MPIYEYICQKCGEKTEVIHAYSDPPLKICPHCGGRHLKKAFSAPAIQFKGSGWYVTDYGKGGSGPRKNESESGDKSGPSETSEKSEKAEKVEKSEKGEKGERSESKSASGADSGKKAAETKSEPRKKGAKKAD